jgi:hypothetical protein
MDIELVEYSDQAYVPSEREWSLWKDVPGLIPDFVGCYTLTPLGKTVLEELDQNQ